MPYAICGGLPPTTLNTFYPLFPPFTVVHSGFKEEFLTANLCENHSPTPPLQPTYPPRSSLLFGGLWSSTRNTLHHTKPSTPLHHLCHFYFTHGVGPLMWKTKRYLWSGHSWSSTTTFRRTVTRSIAQLSPINRYPNRVCHLNRIELLDFHQQRF